MARRNTNPSKRIHKHLSKKTHAGSFCQRFFYAFLRAITNLHQVPVQENISLRPYNTFGIDVAARYFITVKSIETLKELLIAKTFSHFPKIILGGGSNVLFTKDIDALVIKNDIKGIEVIRQDSRYIFIRSAGGEVWHNLVMYCVEHNYGGIENLSLIPGSAGAGPMQNIGAYGVELKDTFYELEALDINTGETRIFNADDCEFGYRQSIFKNKAKNKYVITWVTLRLYKQPEFNITYGALVQELERMQVEQLTIKAVSSAVINIRRSKLPDPALIGNAGSFFKNPEVTKEYFENLKQAFPACVGYRLDNGNVKLAAGWLIEQCGWKGKVVGRTGAHKDQALVLVNYGGATGAEIFKLSEDIKKSVSNKFNVELETEVNVL